MNKDNTAGNVIALVLITLLVYLIWGPVFSGCNQAPSPPAASDGPGFGTGLYEGFAYSWVIVYAWLFPVVSSGTAQVVHSSAYDTGIIVGFVPGIIFDAIIVCWILTWILGGFFGKNT